MIKLDSEPKQQIYMKIISVGCTANSSGQLYRPNRFK